MKNNKYNLVVLHHEEVFETRELALDYLNGFYKPNSLDGEPVIVKYGDERNPNIILAFGTSDTAPGSFYAIDIAKTEEIVEELSESIEGDKEELDYVAEVLQGVIDASGLTLDENKIQDKISYDPDTRDEVIGNATTIAEAIDLLSKYVQQGLAENELTVEDSESVAFIYTVNPNGGKTLKATVKISNDGDSDALSFNNNIIGIKNDGVFAAANLSYDNVRHELTFTTSGYDDNGRFKDDAKVKTIELGEHTKLVADNDGKTVRLNVSENENTTTLSANLEIADRENNILKASDGKVFVDGLAKNIKYGESTVAATLTAHKNRLEDLETSVEDAAKSAHVEGGQTDTLETQIEQLSDGGAKVTGNVRLGSNNSIVVRNGGLEANINIDVNTATNKLIVTIGNQTVEKTLPGVELFENAEYDDASETLIITFRNGSTLVVPIHDIIHTWDTENSESSPITLTKTEVVGGVDKLSGNVKLRSTDNLIGIENGKLYVSNSNIDSKVTVETTRATAAERELQRSIETLGQNIESQFDEVSDSISAVNTAITEEATRAREAESGLSTSLSTLETTVDGIEDSIAEIPTLRTNLNNEITRSTTKDTELEGLIAAASESVLTEKNRALTAEETLNNRIAHDISDVNSAITDEIARATAAEEANAARIDELAESVGEGSAQTLADAKEYTDTKVLAEKTERERVDGELGTQIESLETDLTNEVARATAAEADLTTELNKKIETVEIVKNSQSDLQYVLKVDGQDVSEINIPKDQFLKTVSYDAGNKELVFVFETTDGTVTTRVSVNDLVDTYEAGNGLVLVDNQFSVKLNEETESYLTLSSEGIKLDGIDSKFAETATNANAYTDAEVLEEKTAREAKDTEIEAAVSDIEDSLETLSTTVDDMKFITNESDTVRMTMVKETGAETRVLSSDVKLKTLSGGTSNIIKSDANGIFATVTLSYDKANNKLTFNDGNASQVFELNNFGILQDAFYDSQEKNIVLVVKKDDESTERITIPVGDLVNTWDVENAENSPVVLTKTEGNDGDVLSATVSILNNANNLLVNQNGSLFVDGDCNSHKALWGNEVTDVQGAINLLKERTDDIEEMKEDIEELQEDNENIKIAIASYQTDLENQKDRITTNEENIATLVEKTHEMEVELAVLQERINDFDERITEATDKANEAITTVNNLTQIIGDIDTSKGSISDRLDAIEEVLRQLIDFGEYDIQI